jgi:hypothetical protein
VKSVAEFQDISFMDIVLQKKICVDGVMVKLKELNSKMLGKKVIKKEMKGGKII